jgi:hypothetical protein
MSGGARDHQGGLTADRPGTRLPSGPRRRLTMRGPGPGHGPGSSLTDQARLTVPAGGHWLLMFQGITRPNFQT